MSDRKRIPSDDDLGRHSARDAAARALAAAGPAAARATAAAGPIAAKAGHVVGSVLGSLTSRVRKPK
jgi:hypothetical protein